MQIISTSTHTYLVSFLNSTETFIVGDSKSLGKLIVDRPNMYVDKIKIFNKSKNKFIKLSKKDLRQFVNWDTETAIELNKRKLI